MNHPALPSAQTFINMQPKTGAPMLRRDLERAKIEYENELGTADFHALRHTFCSLLARSGVQPQTAQRLMRHSDINLTMKHYTHILLDDKRMAVSSLPRINVEENITEATGTEDAANLGRFNAISDLKDSACFLPTSATSTDISKAEFRQIEKSEKSQISGANTSNTSANTIKDSVECTKSTLDTLDTNWWARRDLNPAGQTHKSRNNSNLQNQQNITLPTVCPKSQARFSDENPQKNVLLDDILNQHNLSLAQAILAIDQLPIDSSTKVSLIKELATKLTESTEPESPEDSPNE